MPPLLRKHAHVDGERKLLGIAVRDLFERTTQRARGRLVACSKRRNPACAIAAADAAYGTAKLKSVRRRIVAMSVSSCQVPRRIAPTRASALE